MAKKTNKTSHVLNLITNGEPEIAKEPEKAEPKPKESEKAEKKAKDTKVTVVNVDKENSEVSEEIQKQLLNQLPEETALLEKEIEPKAEPEKVPELKEKTEKVPEAKTDEMPEELDKFEMPEDVARALEASAASEEMTEEAVLDNMLENITEEQPMEEPEIEPVSQEEPEEEYHMVNVMESVIKRAGLVKHMKEYGVCTCSRCQADVMALVLTRLPSKYVIVDETAANPMISYYESRFRMRILTEIIKSCMDVKDKPRH